MAHIGRVFVFSLALAACQKPDVSGSYEGDISMSWRCLGQPEKHATMKSSRDVTVEGDLVKLSSYTCNLVAKRLDDKIADLQPVSCQPRSDGTVTETMHLTGGRLEFGEGTLVARVQGTAVRTAGLTALTCEYDATETFTRKVKDH